MWGWTPRQLVVTARLAARRRADDGLLAAGLVRAAVWADREGWAKVTRPASG